MNNLIQNLIDFFTPNTLESALEAFDKAKVRLERAEDLAARQADAAHNRAVNLRAEADAAEAAVAQAIEAGSRACRVKERIVDLSA